MLLSTYLFVCMFAICMPSSEKCLFKTFAGKIWHIYTMEYYAAIKNVEFVSFVGTWINLKNITLSKLTQEQKMKYRIFSLIGGWRTMRTHGHREVSTTHWGLLWGIGEGQRGGELGRDSMGRNARCGWRGGRQQITLPHVYLCNYLACSAHVPQNLKCNKNKSLLFIIIKNACSFVAATNQQNTEKSEEGNKMQW